MQQPNACSHGDEFMKCPATFTGESAPDAAIVGQVKLARVGWQARRTPP